MSHEPAQNPPDGLPPEIMRFLDAEIEERETAAAIEGFEAGVRAVLGPPLARAVMLSLLGPAAPGEETAEGVSRAVASKWVCRIRRNLGFQIEHPEKARAGGRKAKGGA